MYIFNKLDDFRKELSKIDFSTVGKEDIDNSFAYRSGLVYINKIVEEVLSNYTDQYFFEYSLLSSTINPCSSELYSFAAINSPNDAFVKRIEQYVNSIIRYVYPSEKKDFDKIELLSWNWFHNPELFLFPTINQIEPCICKETVSCDVDIIKPDKTGYYHKIDLDKGKQLYVYNMSYRRKLIEMLEASSRISSRNPDVDSLIQEYHLGVSKSKRFYDKYLRDNENENYWHVAFPLLSAKNSYLSDYYKAFYPDKYLANFEHVPGIGHFFIYFKLKDNIDEKELEDAIQNLFVELNHYIGFISNNYTYATGLALLDSVNKESIKSAKSAIMSRNMSHNLGSHFISNTKNYFNALMDVDNDNEAIYRGIKYALQYIQERMDFIATVTSDDKYPFGSVNAKAQIFDELTPDDLGKRHEKHSLNFLMDYLVLSEKISKRSHLNCEAKKPLLSDGKYELKLIMGYEDKEGNVFFWDSENTTSAENRRKDDLVNINFAIPGGVLGRHALFSIIENIIRNAAKHGQDKINGKFEIKMLCTNDDHFIIFDNKRDSTIRDTVKNLNDRLSNLKMYNDDNTLNQDNKGLKEILICAAWLQNADFIHILRSKEFNKYVQILALDKDGKELNCEVNEGYLGYRIKLDRYKKIVHLNSDILGISDDAEEIDIELLKKIKADIICASKDYRVGESVLSQICPHFAVISLNDFNKRISEKGEYEVAVEFLRSIVEKKCHIKTNGLQMVLSSDKKNDYIGSEPYPVAFYDNYIEKSKDDFLYKVHAGKSKWSKFETLYLTKGFEDKYIDSISGGDFTYTVVQPSFVKDEYNLLKIYESVKTKFVIIDERVYEQCRSSLTKEQRDKMLLTVMDIKQKISSGKKSVENLIDHLFLSERGPKVLGHCDLKEENKKLLRDFLMDDSKLQSFLEKDIEQHYLERKNIHIFSFDNHQNNYSLNDISGKEYGHFEMTDSELSFIPQNEEQHYFKPCDNSPITFLSIHLGLIDKIKDNLGLANDTNFNESLIVEELKSYFGATFVSIHSGRGGFDVRNSLKKYVFQSYSAVENPLHNSKFLLAQQFYNLNYYGSVK